MISLRLLSVILIIFPGVLGAIIMMQKSHIVSWIYAIVAIAAIPVIGLPLGIGVNLIRLNWPISFVAPIVILLSLTTIGWLFPKSHGGADRIFIPFIILLIEYVIFMSLSNSSSDWSTSKRFLISFLMICPLALGSARGLWRTHLENEKVSKEIEKNSVQIGNFNFRRGNIYDNSKESYLAQYRLKGEDSEKFTRGFDVDLINLPNVTTAEERVLYFNKSKDALSTTSPLDLTPLLIRAQLFKTKFADGRSAAILLITSTHGVLGYWLTWRNVRNEEMEKDLQFMIQAAATKKLPLPRNTTY